ncbi:MAG: hypothetical protein JWQ09_5825 [Segetibacter sp.]|nr:hypothetical protein [Segetibacter sp.]
MDRLSYLALKQRQELPPITGWKVISCGVIAYENDDIKLCWHYIRIHNIKNVKPIPIR